MKANPSTEMGDGLLSLCWNNHRSTFCHVISTLREKERFSDVTLACEGRYYPVHKLVLSVCSDYFDSMLERTPCKHPVIVLRDVQPDDLEALLSYMYEGIVSVAQNDLARLIKTAEMLRIKGLAVPDDPVPSGGETRRQSLGGNSQSPSRSGRESRESRTSPSAKRRRREENGGGRETSHGQSTNDSTDISSLSPHDNYDTRTRTNTRESSHIETKQEVMQSHDIEEVIVPETLVKQEIEESDSIQKSDSSLLGGYGDSSQMGSQQSDHSVLSHRYDSSGADPQHSQPLEEAVAEALAGPSGMQTWLGGGELNSSSFTTVDAYSTESGDVGSQQLGQQQMESNHIEPRVTLVNVSLPVSSSTQVIEMPSQVPIAHHHVQQPQHETLVTVVPCQTQPSSVLPLVISTQHQHQPHQQQQPPQQQQQQQRVVEQQPQQQQSAGGNQNLKCQYCQRATFRQTSDLKRHIRIHTGEKPFKCSYCPYKASRKDLLHAHSTKMHSRAQP